MSHRPICTWHEGEAAFSPGESEPHDVNPDPEVLADSIERMMAREALDGDGTTYQRVVIRAWHKQPEKTDGWILWAPRDADGSVKFEHLCQSMQAAAWHVGKCATNVVCLEIVPREAKPAKTRELFAQGENAQ